MVHGSSVDDVFYLYRFGGGDRGKIRKEGGLGLKPITKQAYIEYQRAGVNVARTRHRFWLVDTRKWRVRG
jgi:hypothetical protein